MAKTKQQQLFYLTGMHARQELREIRLREQFFCPSCQAPLLLKIGEITIPHFAHKSLSDCDNFSEPESSLHLHGKLLLHQFFLKLNFSIELEKYLPEIRQRADLLVEGKYAIEFQCSTIPVLQLKQRSKGYRQLLMHPIWIKGVKQPCREEIGVLRIKAHEMAMEQTNGSSSFILLFHPSGNQFYYYSNLFYISANRWVGKTKSIQAINQVFPFAVPKCLSKEEFSCVWRIFRNARQQYIRNQLYAGNQIRNKFCRLCYELRIDAANVPELFGIPMQGAECLKQPAIMWQMQAVAAWKKGVPVETLIASGSLAVAGPGFTAQASGIVSDYLTLYLSAQQNSLIESKLLDCAYDIYCKNLRKLRK